MEYVWNTTPQLEHDEVVYNQLAHNLNISPLFAKLLFKRGIDTEDKAQVYLRPNIDHLHDPFLMQDMTRAVNRLQQAKTNNEKILVYGDYDVDGVTAVAMMTRFLRSQNFQTTYYIPDRHEEGYGVSKKGVDVACKNNCQLLITLDCGISNADTIHYASENHIDTIVCDHHNVSEKLPPACAVLDMKRADCSYPYKDLSGCGVGFKLIHAFCKNNSIPFEHILDLTQLVAISTACDIVSMTGENRTLVAIGLEQIRKNPLKGIDALLQISQVDKTNITTDDLGYRVGPRINASGRLYSAVDALKLLIADNAAIAHEQAKLLNKYNEERQNKLRTIEQEALALLTKDRLFEQMHTTIVYGPNWHKGVIGIVASLLVKQYYRPTIVFTDDKDDCIVGSARSAGNFDLYQAIKQTSHLLIKYGGHQSAAGLTLKKANLEKIKREFDKIVSTSISDTNPKPILAFDCYLNLSEINEQLYNDICLMQPFGPDNPQPLFVTQHLIDSGFSRQVGKDNKHLKLSVTDNHKNTANGIAFGMGQWSSYVKSNHPFSLCYSIEKNTFNGIASLQLSVKDIKKE